MEIYKFFYPHFNPLLQSTPLRQQELIELEQAASLLRKAVEKAQQRSKLKGPFVLPSDTFSSLVKATKFIEGALGKLSSAHPGDTSGALFDLIQERAELPGWKSWSSLLREQLIEQGKEWELERDREAALPYSQLPSSPAHHQ